MHYDDCIQRRRGCVEEVTIFFLHYVYDLSVVYRATFVIAKCQWAFIVYVVQFPVAPFLIRSLYKYYLSRERERKSLFIFYVILLKKYFQAYVFPNKHVLRKSLIVPSLKCQFCQFQVSIRSLFVFTSRAIRRPFAFYRGKTNARRRPYLIARKLTACSRKIEKQL